MVLFDEKALLMQLPLIPVFDLNSIPSGEWLFTTIKKMFQNYNQIDNSGEENVILSFCEIYKVCNDI